MMKRIQLADFVKGYSIFTIVLFHYMQTLSLSPFLANAIKIGGTGAHTFLVISGFGLYLSYLNKPLGFRQFIKRRLGKVYIPYIIIVLLSAFITLFIPIFQSSWYALGGHVFLYKMFDSSIMGSYGGQFWFISTIIQFYLVFHGLVWLKERTNNAVFLIIGLVVSFGWMAFTASIGKSLLESYFRFFLQYAWEFMLGMVIAGMVKDNSGQKIMAKLTIFHFLIVGVVGVAMYVLMAVKMGYIGQLFNDVPAVAGYGCLAIFLYKLRIAPINKFFLYTGDISYSLFIVHILVNTLVLYFFQPQTMSVAAALLLLSLIISYIVAHIYNKFIAQLYKRLGI